MVRLGTRVSCTQAPGQQGTVVHVTGASDTRPDAGAAFDVVWDDLSSMRSVPREEITGPNWTVVPGDFSAAQCKALWFDHLVHRSRQMALACAAHSPRTADHLSESTVRGWPVATRPSRVGMQQTLTAIAPATTANAKATAQRAGELLVAAFPSTQFTISCARRMLTVTWMDGPIEGNAFGRLDVLKRPEGLLSIRLSRQISAQLAQCAVDYCLKRTAPAAKRDLLARRVNVHAYTSKNLSTITPAGGAASGVSYQSLIRCVLDKWDDEAGRFMDTRSTRGLVQELQALYPDGERVAASEFRVMRGFVRNGDQRDGFVSAERRRERES